MDVLIMGHMMRKQGAEVSGIFSHGKSVIFGFMRPPKRLYPDFIVHPWSEQAACVAPADSEVDSAGFLCWRGRHLEVVLLFPYMAYSVSPMTS